MVSNHRKYLSYFKFNVIKTFRPHSENVIIKHSIVLQRTTSISLSCCVFDNISN